MADLADHHQLTYVDIGLRGGFQDDLSPLAFAVNAIGFEPEQSAYKELVENPDDRWRSVKILPVAVGPENGLHVLTIPRENESSTLLIPDPALGERFNKPGYFEVSKSTTVETQILDDALSQADVSRVDYVKIDIEGPELAVMRAAPKTMAGLLAAKLEVSFLPFRKSQPLAHDVAEFFYEQGFELMEIVQPAHWRRQGYIIDPYLAPETPSYSKGQIMQCDYLFLRAPDRLLNDIDAVIRLSLIAMGFGYFDHALSLLEPKDVSDHLRKEFDIDAGAMIHQASKVYGRRAFGRAAYRQLRGLVPFIRYTKNLFR